VGISAPSIYAHFPDREAIVEAIIDAAFADFNAAIKHARDTASKAGDGPYARLRAVCATYLRFAAERPNRYRLLFERHYVVGEGQRPASAFRQASFDLLVGSLQDCVEAGISASTDPGLDATAIWAALHGFATLHARVPMHPWPDADTLLDRIVCGLAQITSEH
jgi:AcrR family transcriptional regulator